MSDLTLSGIAEYLEAQLRGEAEMPITGINTLQDAQAGQIAFLANPSYKKFLPVTKASAVILTATDAEGFSGNAIILQNPYVGYAKLSALFAENRDQEAQSAKHQSVIHPTANIADSATLGEGVKIGPNVVIESGVALGDGSQVGAGCFIGRNSTIREETLLYPNVTIYSGASIGANCIFHSGVILGADGFGFAPNEGEFIKIHQLGSVEIGNNVELGANTCIDRGALGNTVIGDGVKVDNLVQIGHNCQIGSNTVISGCTAIAGSVEIGQNCMIGGAVGIVGHISIADGVMITAMTLVTGSIKTAGSYSSGTNYSETVRWRKNAVRFGQLDDLNRRIRQLEKQLKLHD